MLARTPLRTGLPSGANKAPPVAPACFFAVMDALHEGVAVFDPEDRFVFWNRRYAEIYGLSSDGLHPGVSFATFLKRGAEAGQYLDAVGRLDEWLAERLAVTADRTHKREHLPGDRWTRVREQPLDSGGRLRVVIDATGVGRTDTSFRLLFDANPLPMSLVDAKTLKFLAANEAAVAKYGYPLEWFLEKTMVDLAPPEVQGGLKTIMTSKLGGYDGQTIWTHVTADGQRFQLRPYVRPLIYEGRACLLCAAVDVTEAVRSEAEMRRAHDAAESQRVTGANALTALKDALRGPLEMLAGPSEALVAAELDPEAKALADVVRAAVLSLERALANAA